MRYPFKLTPIPLLAALLTLGPGTAGGQAGLSHERAAGLGLKTQALAVLPADLAFGGEALQVWQMARASDYALYGGAREMLRPGMNAVESYGGIVYALPRNWGTSLEAGYAPVSLFSPQRYSLTGQLHTAFAGGDVSLGLKYRTYGGDTGGRGTPFDAMSLNGYTLAPTRLPGVTLAPGVQLQMSFQYSAAGTVGLALGREAETFTPFLDPSSLGQRPFTLTGQHWLTPSWALSYDLQPQDVTSPLRLQGLLRLGVRYRF